MTGLPIVSVVIPTYERRHYVGRAVASVLAQTYRDFEVIVVDDGSTDGTAHALEGLDVRLRYRWQENRGVSAARNAGARLARGEIIALLDSDDRWLPHHLAVVTEVFARNPEVVLVSTCPRFQIGGRERPADATVFDALPQTLIENVVGCQSGVAVRRADLLAVGGYDERLSVMEGSELWPRLAARGPFATLRVRTVIRQATGGSHLDRGRRDGLYLPALELAARSALALVEQLTRSNRGDLEQKARGRWAYAAALRALAGHHDETARSELRTAYRLLPELSNEPLLVALRLSYLASDRAERLRQLMTAASIWPDRGSNTALFLRRRRSPPRSAPAGYERPASCCGAGRSGPRRDSRERCFRLGPAG
jgi:Glycosyl transferase family 2